MIALGGPKLKPVSRSCHTALSAVSMIALGGPKLKPLDKRRNRKLALFQ